MNLEISIPEVRGRRIENLVEEGIVTSEQEYATYALTLLEWAINERREGRIVASIDDQSSQYRELVMPILSYVEPENGEKNESPESIPERMGENNYVS